MADDLVPRRGARLSRSQREERGYRRVLVGGGAGIVAAVGVLLAAIGVIGWGVPVVALVVMAICALLFRGLAKRR